MNRKSDVNVKRPSQKPVAARPRSDDKRNVAAEGSRDWIGGPSVPISWPIIEVSSYSELSSKVAELAHSNRLSFRGQVRDYGQILCSVARKLRGITVPALDLAELNSDRAKWLQATSELTKQILPVSPESPDAVPALARQLLAEALLQHYGCQSHFIDASWNLEVAVYFALFQYHERFPVLEGKSTRPKLSRVAWYQSSEEPYGFLYVFDRPVLRTGEIHHGDVIDLTFLAPPGYNRIREQQGAVIYADLREPGPGDLGPLVRAVYKFPNPLPGAQGAMLRHLLLFPNPGADPIYRTLLHSRFIEVAYMSDRVFKAIRRTATTKGESQYKPVKYPRRKKIPIYVRPFDIPEHHLDLKAAFEFEMFRVCDRVLKPTFYFTWLKKHTNSIDHAIYGKEFSAQRRKWRKVFEMVKEARPILLNSPLTAFASVDPSLASTRFDSPERTINVFLEFSPYNFVGPLAADQAIRGIWLAGDKQSFLVNVFGSADERPWMGEFCSFEWRQQGYSQTVPLKGPEIRPFFLLALQVLRAVSEGKAEIVPPNRGGEYHQFRWGPEWRGWEFGALSTDEN